MRGLDGRLSQVAQARLQDGSALVHVEEDGTYSLERTGEAPLGLGDTHSEAAQAINALAAARRARSRE